MELLKESQEIKDTLKGMTGEIDNHTAHVTYTLPETKTEMLKDAPMAGIMYEDLDPDIRSLRQTVLYDRGQPHAVLLTDYTNGTFYCSDPAGNISSGRIPLESSSVSVNRSSCYWYVASDHNSIAAEADGLRLESMSYPINVRAGKGMALTGTCRLIRHMSGSWQESVRLEL